MRPKAFEGWVPKGRTRTRGGSKRKLTHPERTEQEGIVRLLGALGAKVYRLGTTRRKDDYQGTMQTPGLPDLIAFLPRRTIGPHLFIPARHVVIECKAPRGKRSPAQDEFREWCLRCAVAHITGGVDAVIAWLIAEEYLRADQVAHFHTSEVTR